jgi:membrane-associated phospholipid phosphatase
MFFCFHACIKGYICPSKKESKLLQSTQYAMFRRAVFFSLLLCLLLFLFFLFYGKTGSFLLINSSHSPALDVLFKYGTFLGDGLIYIPLLVYCIFFNRSLAVPAVLSILICIVLTHFFKRVIFPDALRPLSLEAQQFTLHKVAGVHINRVHSFPSGHTATAFATALLLVSVLKRGAWTFLVMLIPFFVGYSRVYLAQHYVSDVLGGMLIGIITAVVSIWWQHAVSRALPWRVQLQKGEQEAA